jgi:hypothetical protein
MLNEEMLKDSWQYIRKDAACGVDRVSAKEYEQNLDENICQLVEDLKRKRYRAKHVLRRVCFKQVEKVPKKRVCGGVHPRTPVFSAFLQLK